MGITEIQERLEFLESFLSEAAKMIEEVEGPSGYHAEQIENLAEVTGDDAGIVEEIITETDGDLSKLSEEQKVKLGNLVKEEDRGVKKAISLLEEFLESQVKEAEEEITLILGFDPK